MDDLIKSAVAASLQNKDISHNQKVDVSLPIPFSYEEPTLSTDTHLNSSFNSLLNMAINPFNGGC